MAKQRYINTHFWDDSYVVELDPIEKLLFLYFLTNPLTNIAGAYEVSLRRVAFDTGIDKEMIVKILARFEKSNKIIYRDGWILITNFIKNQSFNPKMLKGVQDVVSHCPQWIKDRLAIAYQSLSHLNRDLNRDLNCISTDSLSAGDQIADNLKVSKYGEPFESKSKHSENPELESELESWMDEVAKTIGATSRKTMTDAEKWEVVCIKAISGDQSLENLLRITKNEIQRLKSVNELHFFSPNNILKQLQISSAKHLPPPAAIPDWQKGIENCSHCDAKGYARTNGGMVVCKHDIGLTR